MDLLDFFGYKKEEEKKFNIFLNLLEFLDFFGFNGFLTNGLRLLLKFTAVFKIIGKSHYQGRKKDATFTLRHIVTECDTMLPIFLDF